MSLSRWSQALMRALTHFGVRQMVLSPGARCMNYAFMADAEPGLETWDVVNEGTAAFVALGLLRADPRHPVAVLCTSGTAAAHYFPAVMEAARARLPLIVLTADRPPKVHNMEAPQTVHQGQLFGDHVRAFFEMGLPESSQAWRQASVQRVGRAIAIACGPEPGPVQINLPASKPLGPNEAELAEIAGKPHKYSRYFVPERRIPKSALDALEAALKAAKRPICAAGPRPVHQASLASGGLSAAIASLELPLFAEATSQLRFQSFLGTAIDAFPEALRLAGLPGPDLVLQLGGVLSSAAYLALVQGQSDLQKLVVSPHGWPDPEGEADAIFEMDAEPLLTALAERGVKAKPDPAWIDALWAANQQVAQALERAMAAFPGLTEGQAIRRFVSPWPEDCDLLAGNGLSVRNLDRFLPQGALHTRVFHQRGLNGIDGLFAQAAGIAWGSGRRLRAVIGDLSAVHDLSGLSELARLQKRVQLLVIDNQGGRIFDGLPVARTHGQSAGFQHLRAYPDRDLAGIGQAMGLWARRVRSLSELDAAIVASNAQSGPSLIVAEVHGDDTEALQRRFKAEMKAGRSHG